MEAIKVILIVFVVQILYGATAQFICSRKSFNYRDLSQAKKTLHIIISLIIGVLAVILIL
jgi:hypothetical protein